MSMYVVFVLLAHAVFQGGGAYPTKEYPSKAIDYDVIRESKNIGKPEVKRKQFVVAFHASVPTNYYDAMVGTSEPSPSRPTLENVMDDGVRNMPHILDDKDSLTGRVTYKLPDDIHGFKTTDSSTSQSYYYENDASTINYSKSTISDITENSDGDEFTADDIDRIRSSSHRASVNTKTSSSEVPLGSTPFRNYVSKNDDKIDFDTTTISPDTMFIMSTLNSVTDTFMYGTYASTVDVDVDGGTVTMLSMNGGKGTTTGRDEVTPDILNSTYAGVVSTIYSLSGTDENDVTSSDYVNTVTKKHDDNNDIPNVTSSTVSEQMPTSDSPGRSRSLFDDCNDLPKPDINRGDTAILDYLVTSYEHMVRCKCGKCLNGATCHLGTNDEVMCECPTCFEGDNCGIAFDGCTHGWCQHGGVCQSEQGSCGAYLCLCQFPFYGPQCEQDKSDILRRFGYNLR